MMKSRRNVKRLPLKRTSVSVYTSPGERRRVELKQFNLAASVLGLWREGVHKDTFLGHGVGEGGSGVKE